MRIEEIKTLCVKHGGQFHGPNVEHLSIPESALPALFAEFMAGKVLVGASDLQRIMELVERWAVSSSMDDRAAYHNIRKILPERPWGQEHPTIREECK